MTAKTDLINNLRNSGIDLAVSTLKRKSMAELETIWSALQSRDEEATAQSINDGKVEDLVDRQTDCGGCENGECDGCGYYDCCNNGAGYEGDPLVEDYNTTGDLVSWMLNLAEQAYSPRQVGTELAGQAKSDGQSKVMKDREEVAPALNLVRETMKVVTAAGYQKDPENMKAALQALAQIAAKAADQI